MANGHTGDPIVSILLPVFNAAATIENAVRSASGQTLTEIEIIAYDDCSTDDSLMILNELTVVEPRLRVIKGSPNIGPAAGRNRAIAVARGRWVAVLDSDDWYLAERLSRLVAIGEEAKADFVVDNHWLYDSAADTMVGTAFREYTGYRSLTLREFLRNTMTGISPYDFGLLQPMIRRDFLEGQNIQYREDCRYGEDFIFALECLMAGARSVLTGQALYVVTQPLGSYSGRLSTPTRLGYEYRDMLYAHQATLERVRDSLASEDVQLLEKRGRAIADYDRYLRLKKMDRLRKMFWGLACSPSLWPFVTRALTRRLPLHFR